MYYLSHRLTSFLNIHSIKDFLAFLKKIALKASHYRNQVGVNSSKGLTIKNQGGPHAVSPEAGRATRRSSLAPMCSISPQWI